MLSYAKSGTAKTGDRLNGFKKGKTQQFNSGGVGKWAYFPPKNWSIPLSHCLFSTQTSLFLQMTSRSKCSREVGGKGYFCTISDHSIDRPSSGEENSYKKLCCASKYAFIVKPLIRFLHHSRFFFFLANFMM